MQYGYLSKMLMLSLVLILCSITAFGSDANCSETKCGEIGPRIHDIQGATHESPLAGLYVKDVPGIVTAIKSNGFYMQDNFSDCWNSTSEGLFVFTNKKPDANVGNYLLVSGFVDEYRQGEGLSLTEIKNPSIRVEPGNPSLKLLPPAVLIGTNGRAPPDTVIDDDNLGEFNDQVDGADFFESLEGMRVQIRDAFVLTPSSKDGKLIYVLADNGSNASLRSARGGILLRPGDFNPERIAIVYKKASKTINAGDRLKEPITGVLTYDTSNNRYQVEADMLNASSGSLAPEIIRKAKSGELSIATFNVDNLPPKNDDVKKRAHEIVFNLSLPDIIALQEVGDNNGENVTKDDHVVAADLTFGQLIKAINESGGVVYNYTNINPLYNQDGGTPGLNIRVGILYRTDKGLKFVNRTGGDATSPTTITVDELGKPHLSHSPGRIDPLNPAFDNSRKPLAAEFIYNGSSLFVIANHLNSKGGDQSIYGANQPLHRSSENQRHKQAQVIKNFVNQILKADPNANVVVLGDMNDFQFSETLNILKGGDLTDVIESLAPNQQYTYIYEGNSQALDHILLSNNLTKMGFEPDAAHINSEFANSPSDHDPLVVRIMFT
jgi:predicted extracellular nuclease